MAETASLTSLILAAQLAGTVLTVPPAVPPAVGPSAPPQAKPVLTLTLKEIALDQARAAVTESVGRGAVSFSVGLDPKADLWIKLRQGDFSIARPLKDFTPALEADFPVERYGFLYENGNIRAYPAEHPQRPQAIVSIPSLIRSLYNYSLHVLFTPAEYAVVYEDGKHVPASISLIRQDYSGRLMVTHKSLQELTQIVWFVSVNGTMYGMRHEGENLVFYAKPTAASDKKI